MAPLLDVLIAQVHTFRRQLRSNLDTINVPFEEVEREAGRLAMRLGAVERVTHNTMAAWMRGRLSDASAAKVLAGLLPS